MPGWCCHIAAEGLRGVLKGGTVIAAGQEAFTVTRSLPHGHVAAAFGTARKIGLDLILGPSGGRGCDLALAMRISRILDPASKLATARALSPGTAASSLGEALRLGCVDDDELYAALDWLLERHPRLACSLARHRSHPGQTPSHGTLVLYDVSSSYMAGRCCPLAKRGYSRDGRRGTLQIVYGLLCVSDGCPVAIEVFDGNTADPKTLTPQIEKLKQRFHLDRVVLVGDRGMITEARITEDLKAAGLDWITALRAPAIKALMNSGALQLTLFDQRDMAAITSPDFPGERLIVCRNPDLAAERARKREELLAATEKDLGRVKAAVERKRNPLSGATEIRLAKNVERIELPPIRPDVTQVRLFGGRCACCGERVTATAPAGLEPGSPFGNSIAAMVVYLHYAHAIGMERLALVMDELFSLSISEGAISNILARAREPLLDATATIEKVVLASPVICSDETSVRVKGKNWWEWVVIGTLAVLHVIQPSRGKAVVTALFGAIRPEVWVSDMLGSQRGHGVLWQMCLAHLLRDAKYAIECGDTAFSPPFRWLLLRTIAIGRRRETLKDTTLKQYLYDLDRRLDRIMAAVPVGEPGRKLHKRVLANRAHLFVFMTNRAVPCTNNVSERHLRPSVIFRKLTNGFRCEWGAETYAAFRSVVSTAKANRASVLDTVRFVLSTKTPGEMLAGVG